jgi:hypothetical protein
MAVADKDISLDFGGRLGERVSEESQATACVEHEQAIAAADFDARRVPAISRCPVPRTRDAAAHAPEANQHVSQRELPARVPPLSEIDVLSSEPLI